MRGRDWFCLSRLACASNFPVARVARLLRVFPLPSCPVLECRALSLRGGSLRCSLTPDSLHSHTCILDLARTSSSHQQHPLSASTPSSFSSSPPVRRLLVRAHARAAVRCSLFAAALFASIHTPDCPKPPQSGLTAHASRLAASDCTSRLQSFGPQIFVATLHASRFSIPVPPLSPICSGQHVFSVLFALSSGHLPAASSSPDISSASLVPLHTTAPSLLRLGRARAAAANRIARASFHMPFPVARHRFRTTTTIDPAKLCPPAQTSTPRTGRSSIDSLTRFAHQVVA